MVFSGMLLPARSEVLEVMSNLQAESLMRPGQRLGAEPAEHDRVNRADARAGEHDDGQFGNHRQINRDAVAFLDAERFQHVGELADLLVQLRVGEFYDVVFRLALPEEGDLVARLGFQMAVQAVDASR